MACPQHLDERKPIGCAHSACQGTIHLPECRKRCLELWSPSPGQDIQPSLIAQPGSRVWPVTKYLWKPLAVMSKLINTHSLVTYAWCVITPNLQVLVHTCSDASWSWSTEVPCIVLQWLVKPFCTCDTCGFNRRLSLASC